MRYPNGNTVTYTYYYNGNRTSKTDKDGNTTYYMNPGTGTFISKDSYQGNIYDPVTLHKYLYANANPVMYTDPSGYFSLAECSISTSIQTTLNSMHQIAGLQRLVKWADAMCTVYDVAMEVRNAILGGGTVLDVMGALLKGVVVGFMVDGMCKTSLGIILKPMMAIFGLGDQVDQIQKALESGDPAEIAVRFVQLACMLFGITSQCFTGDTLVSTEDGLRPIEEIEVGDYVWAEDTATGDKELKEIVRVFESETDTLVHVTTESGNEIDTTKNHPFYVEGRGWCAAVKLEKGDVLRTKDGKTEVVADIEVEELDEPVTVYNLEVKDSHTYYVSTDEVLVHNDCGEVPESLVEDAVDFDNVDYYVTPDGVVLKNKILDELIENPYRTGSYGYIDETTGKYKEILRIDPATPEGKKGPSYSHYHVDNGKEHLSPRPGDSNPLDF